MEAKKIIRSQIRQIKKTLSNQEIDSRSSKITESLLALDVYKNSKDVLVYVNYNQEVSTTDIIDDALKSGKNVYVPKIFENAMEFIRISSRNELLKGAYGILEPVTDEYQSPMTGLMILPGMAFDKNMHRIGYGGGYYDRYLARQNTLYKLALAYDFQVLDEIVYDEYDKTMDMIITDTKIITP
ncbi:MAG: 5-formyltetrahydrofolate cyclo-ligase [Lachnospiraceae bacterium]|nr:5-formyltetrahydrofolate cyclo-ligase [Lachnospiraceae bacterium]